MSSPSFEIWGGQQSPIAIEYSLMALEEIRQEINQGQQKVVRGSLESGGILYGTRDGHTIRITTIRPIECEHEQGPQFVLSSTDRSALAEQLTRQQSARGLEGLVCLGWFVCHTGGEIALTDHDRDVFSSFFRDPWQVTLVVRPGRGRSMRAGFFVWETDGSVKAGESYQEFDFPDRLADVIGHLRRERPPAETRMGPGPRRGGPMLMPSRPEGGLVPPPQAPEQQYQPQQYQSQPQSHQATLEEAFGLNEAPEPRIGHRWLWVSAIVLLAAAVGLFAWNYYGKLAPPPAPIDLVVVDRDGQLEIGWDSRSDAVLNAASGTLSIVDGRVIRNLPLTPEELQRGNYTYARESGDVEVELVIDNADGGQAREASRFLGRPPVPQQNELMDELEARRTELEAEVQRLERENATQAQRIRQLERTLTVLQTRLGIEGN